MAGEKERVNAYLETVKRLEPDMAIVDHDAALASIAISIKRIADSLDNLQRVFVKTPDGSILLFHKGDGVPGWELKI